MKSRLLLIMDGDKPTYDYGCIMAPPVIAESN